MLLKVVTALHTATPKGSARTFLRTMIHVNSGKCDFLLVHPKHHYGSTSGQTKIQKATIAYRQTYTHHASE